MPCPRPVLYAPSFSPDKVTTFFSCLGLPLLRRCPDALQSVSVSWLAPSVFFPPRSLFPDSLNPLLPLFRGLAGLGRVDLPTQVLFSYQGHFFDCFPGRAPLELFFPFFFFLDARKSLFCSKRARYVFPFFSFCSSFVYRSPRPGK